MGRERGSEMIKEETTNLKFFVCRVSRFVH
jgi:hypothetical protein